MQVAVMGCGVIGLSTAILLSREGHKVTIYAKELPPYTVSNVACAIWLPLLVTEPDLISPDQVEMYRMWARKSWRVFMSLVGNEYGVHWTKLCKMFPEEEPRPYFADIVTDFQEGYDAGLPSGLTYKWSFKTLIIETPTYMPALIRDFRKLGGRIIEKSFHSVEDIKQLKESVVFNCTGLGAREILGDSTLCPVKGQLILHAPVSLDFSLSCGEYCLIPRSDALVLGALFERKFDTLEPTEAGISRIWTTIHSWIEDGIADIDTSSLNLSKDKVQSIVAGLRPYRPEGIRIEAEVVDDKVLIHNYGHGGSGITFSWGCAEHSLKIMRNFLENK